MKISQILTMNFNQLFIVRKMMVDLFNVVHKIDDLRGYIMHSRVKQISKNTQKRVIANFVELVALQAK